MAKWIEKCYFVFVLLIYETLSDFCVFCNGYSYGKDTQLLLCSAQCEALNLDKVENYEDLCRGNQTWVTNCNVPNCPSTCSVLINRFNGYNEQLLVPVPHLTAQHAGNSSIKLSWNSAPPSPLATIYFVEQTKKDLRWSINIVNIIAWVRNTSILVKQEVCRPSTFRVMAINQVGSLGFSYPVTVPGTLPGRVRNIHYVGAGIYYYKDKIDPLGSSEFMAIMEWDQPEGWNASNVGTYDWNPMVKSSCPQIEQNSLPIFNQMSNQTARRLVRIAANSIGCIFTTQVRAISKCKMIGPWTDFTLNLTDCSAINGYRCRNVPFDTPGNVENVTILATSNRSPFSVNLHIRWRPPTDLGSLRTIHQYIIRSGQAVRNLFPIPPMFNETPSFKNVSQNIREIIFQLNMSKLPYTYGVQVVAVAPGQVIKNNEWGLFPIYTIRVERSHVFHNVHRGKVLLHEDGVIILYVNNTLPVRFMFDTPLGHMDNSSINRYALEWGPLVGPGHIAVENRTIVPVNQSIVPVFLHHRDKPYGLKLKYLSPDEDEPSDSEWAALPIHTFTLPINETGPVVEKLDEGDSPNLLPLYITAAIIVVIAAVVVVLCVSRRHRSLKHLEQRLAGVEEDVGEDGQVEHYFVMNTHSEDNEPAPTVVADQWELPHSCLKVGRVLGSGAFGQVIKGRVSKSLMLHRGIDVAGVTNKAGTHVTVAIKVLQDCTEERYSADFLKEIQMMKDIGYHRNVVSILGCCTLREPYCLVVEHVPNGDLLAYLRKIHHKIQQKEVEIGTYVNQEAEFFSPHDLLSIARQVSVGMEYLSQKGYVHRDLAARNILVGANKTVKIGDFGLARYIYANVGKVYVNRRGGKLPLKWMSVEAIFDLTFSTASDVWAFGVLLFEIVTLGGCPYPDLTNVDLIRQLKQGYRMEKPDNCSSEIYEIMVQCWRASPQDRPGFEELSETFTQLLQDETGIHYIDLNIDPRQYYDINTDDMDTGLPGIIDDADAIDEAVQSAKTLENGLAENLVVTEIPDVNCTTNKSACHENVKGETGDFLKVDGRLVTENYSSREFLRSNSVDSITSIHNQLYDTVVKSGGGIDLHKPVENPMSDIDNKDVHSDSSFKMAVSTTIHQSHVSTKDSYADNRQLQDRISNCSDEVFSSCPGCIMAGTDQTGMGTDDTIYHCLQCGRIGLKLTHFDIHMSDRNDSAISSATSDDLSQRTDRSSDIPSICSDYLLPDSAVGSLTDEYAITESGYFHKVDTVNGPLVIPEETKPELENVGNMVTASGEIIVITHL